MSSMLSVPYARRMVAVQRVFLLALVLAGGCATQSQQTAYPPVDVLILSPQGVAPGADTVGFNDLVRKVTQSFSEKLAAQLETANVSSFNVLDQSTTYTIGQKMSLYAVQHHAKACVVLTMETETAGTDSRLLLQAQYVGLEPTVVDGKTTGVKTTVVFQKRYMLRSSISGDNPGSMTELAAEYAQSIQKEGLIK